MGAGSTGCVDVSDTFQIGEFSFQKFPSLLYQEVGLDCIFTVADFKLPVSIHPSVDTWAVSASWLL